jgi:hypothetical protein
MGYAGTGLMEPEAPRRGRPPREAAEQQERRRRQPGSLNRMVTSPLGIPDECKDPDYHYHWVNDVRGRVQALTTQDDYDIVTVDELEANLRRNRSDAHFNASSFGGNGSTVSLAVERDGTKAILLKKRQSFYDHDYQEGLEQRSDMMKGRVYEGNLDHDAPETQRESSDNTYVPKGNQLPTMRRKGPIPARKL